MACSKTDILPFFKEVTLQRGYITVAVDISAVSKMPIAIDRQN